MTHPLLVAIESNDLEGFKKALHATIAAEGEEEVQMLYTADRLSPTTLAASLGRVDMVKAMHDAGLDMRLEDRRLMTPLHEAASNGHADVVKILRQVPFLKMDTLTAHGETAVHLAAERGQVGVLRELGDGGANMLAKGHLGNDATHYAAQGGHATALKELHEKWGASLMERNSNGDTPAHLAAAENKPDAIREIGRLLQGEQAPQAPQALHARQALGLENYDGNQAIHVAALAGFVDVVRALAEAGVPLDVPNRHGITPAMAAAASLREQMAVGPIAPRYVDRGSRPELVLKVLSERGVAVAQWQQLLGGVGAAVAPPATARDAGVRGAAPGGAAP